MLKAEWNVLNGTVLTPIDDGQIPVDNLEWDVLRGADLVRDQRATTSKGLPPALEDRLTPMRGLGNGKHRIATVSADGRVMGWSEQPPAALATVRTLDKGADWVRASFAGERLVTLDARDTLGVWDVSTGRRLWSGKADGAARFEVAADGSAVHIGNEIINAATGRTVVDLGEEDLDSYELLQHAVVGNRKVVSALSFYTGNSDDFLVRLRDGAHSDEGSVGVEGVKPGDFQGFLLDGRYLIAGSEGSVRIVNWARGTTVAAFRLSESSRIPHKMAINLLKRVTRVEPDTTRQVVRLTLLDGPTLLANLPQETTTALLIDGGTQSIAAPRRPLTGVDATEALSADGRWLATAAKGKLRVWDASNGEPLTEPIPFVGEARDVQFSANGSVVLLATSNGALIRLPVLFRWSSRPAWIAGLAEALTGLTLAKDGRVVAVLPQRLTKIRLQVAARLASDPADTPALRLLRSRLAEARQSPRP